MVISNVRTAAWSTLNQRVKFKREKAAYIKNNRTVTEMEMSRALWGSSENTRLTSPKCKLKNKQGDTHTAAGRAVRPEDSRSSSNSNLLLIFLWVFSNRKYWKSWRSNTDSVPNAS